MSLKTCKLFLFGLCIIVLFLLHEIQGNLDPNGANVCSKTVSFSENYRQSYQVSYRHSSKYKCGLWGWGRCTRNRTAYRLAYRLATRISYTKQYQCCKGWSQVGHQCTKAICTQPCVNGTCTKPNYCSCISGYYGNQCERDCPSHKWGPHCRHDCLCQNNAKCSPYTGICTCTPGWEGPYCKKTCDQGYYGDKCQNNCNCVNGATCDPVSGNCACAAGYKGQRCESQCSPGWYGQDCAVKCACLNGATCNHVNGTCNCTAGWTGDFCNQSCPTGTYGYGCAQKCIDCMHGATCDHVTGICECKLWQKSTPIKQNTVMSGSTSYYLNYFDEVAMSVCTSMQMKGAGYIFSVRRDSPTNSTQTCSQLCTSAVVRKQLTLGSNSDKFECLESLSIYNRRPLLATNVGNNTNVGSIDLVVYRYHNCTSNGCGPNYCCCRKGQ